MTEKRELEMKKIAANALKVGLSFMDALRPYLEANQENFPNLTLKGD